jgi:hypothetical protein
MIYARRADPNALGRFIVAAGRILTVTGFPMLSRTRPMNGTPSRAQETPSDDPVSPPDIRASE